MALKHRTVHIEGGKTVWSVFERSLTMAIRDIESHPRGELLRRLLHYGSADRDDPELLDSDGETVLSDRECGSCIDLIYCHMVNRFKGELAELLALEPVVRLMSQLCGEGRLPRDDDLYWGDEFRERRRLAGEVGASPAWGSYAKGADGLFVLESASSPPNEKELLVHGSVEV